MTAEQRELTFDLIKLPPHGESRISPEEFARLFPSALNNGKLALTLLEEATGEQSSEDVGAALIVGFTFGFSAEHTPVLCKLLEVDWHVFHEDIVSALQDLKDSRAVDTLYKVAFTTHAYLAYDESSGLARKCTWALADIGTAVALARLHLLAASDDPQIARYAQTRIDNWDAER